jgi:hypothetical protein
MAKCDLCSKQTDKITHKDMFNTRLDCCDKCYKMVTFGVKESLDWLITFWLIFFLLLHLNYMLGN